MGKVFKALQRAEKTTDVVEDAITQGQTIQTGGAKAESNKNTVSQEAISGSSFKEAAKKENAAGVFQAKARHENTTLARPGQWDNRLIRSTAVIGPVAESIRSLRTRILYPASRKKIKSLLVTSASPGEGKSFLCANLAVSLAQGLDNHCLLVDCDLRRPTQHKLFGLNNAEGLADYLQHKKEIPELLVASGIEKLSVLQAGSRSVNPAELLGSSTMSQLVDEVVGRYDDRIVVLDSPPLHAASETAILAGQVDAVILTIRYGASRREYIKAVVDSVGREKIIGVVFNAYESTLLDSRVFGYYEYQQARYYNYNQEP